ncbi:MAG: ATP-binding protein [Evtepia sp.]
MRPCQCQKVRQSIRQMRRSGLQHIIQDYTFAKFQATEPWQQKLKAAAQAYAQSLEGWFFFGGQSGSGKTHLCTAICRKALHQGKQVRYMLWRDDVSRIKAVANQGEEYNAAIAPYKHAELLYIDDLFKTGRSFDSRSPRPTTADVNVAFEILNYRYTAKLPTIVSSECVLDDLIQIDESLAGRIAERAKNLFELGPDRGKNYRLRG